MRSKKATVRRGVDLFQCSRVASYEGVGGGRMAQGREIEEGSRVALHGDPSSRGALRRGYFPDLAAPRPCSLALQSRTAALRRAVARPFSLWATACMGSTEGEVTASARGATAGFCGQMHGRLRARLVGGGRQVGGGWMPGWPGVGCQGSKGMHLRPAVSAGGYNAGMSAARPKPSSVPPKTPAAPAKQSKLVSGFPGTDEERAERIRRLAEEHKETLRRLGE